MDHEDLRNFDISELRQIIISMGYPEYRANQLFRWLHRVGAAAVSEMSDLPRELREQLEEHFSIFVPEINKILASRQDGTKKILFQLADREKIETVIMPGDDNRCTVCISSQVGCPVGCTFCATGMSGFTRNLSPSEIICQVYAANRLAEEQEQHWRVTNVVFMGMGEPLINYHPVVKAIRILNDPKGLNISQRRITISTAGYVPGIFRMADEGLQVVLAVSLHAADNGTRDELVPLNRRYPLKELAAACKCYTRKTGRRITLEYALIDGVNDSKKNALALVGFAAPLKANVNVIPLNAVEGSRYRRSDRVREFVGLLCRNGIEAVVRRERGADIQGACGQLRCRPV